MRHASLLPLLFLMMLAFACGDAPPPGDGPDGGMGDGDGDGDGDQGDGDGDGDQGDGDGDGDQGDGDGDGDQGDGDGDGDPGDGDGDGDPGDGDGDGDGDPVAVDKGLEVRSSGSLIGYVVELDQFTVTVFDPATQTLFRLNDSTGFVARWVPTDYYSAINYLEDACAGAPHQLAFDVTACPSEPPQRPFVIGLDNDWPGFTEATQLYAPGVPFVGTVSSRTVSNGTCTEQVVSPTACVQELSPTTLIPTSFPTPIEIVPVGSGV